LGTCKEHVKNKGKKKKSSPFGPPIYVKKGGLWAKHVGLKQGVIGNTFGEHIENMGKLLGT
jgi:hypothetical protein